MKTYNVSVKATYYDDLEIEACDADEAYRMALQEFKPTSDNCLTIDVYGLSPWAPDSQDEDILRDEYVQRELDSK